MARLSLDLVAERYDPRLAHLYQGLQSALAPFAKTAQELQQGAAWLHDLAYILDPKGPRLLKGDQVAEPLRSYLDTIRPRPNFPPTLGAFGHHLDTVSRSYWPGLCHCYDVPGLPRTNNELESQFRDTSRHLMRTTGQKGLTKPTLQRQGAWELLPRPPTELQLLNGVSQIPPEDWTQERQRFAEQRRRFRLQSRSRQQTQTQFEQLRQRWSQLPRTGTG